MAQQMWKWLRVEPQREPHQRLIIGKAGVYNHFFQQTAYRQGAKARKAKKQLLGQSHIVVAASEIFVGLQVKDKPNQLWCSVEAHVLEHVIEENSKVSLCMFNI